MSDLQHRFVFALASPDCVAWFKNDLLIRNPGLTLAYSRPGLYTFKHRSGEMNERFELVSAFARHWGFSLGRAANAAEVHALLTARKTPLGLHVYARDEGEGRLAAPPARIATIRQAILDHGPKTFYANERVAPGTEVVDVIIPPPREGEAESWFVGLHRQTNRNSSLPGGIQRMDPPAHAPSRAWSKIEELIAWASLPVRKGQTVVEIGCAPGGAVLALTDRGMHVTGIDPGEIDKKLISYIAKGPGTFVHLKRPAAEVQRRELPQTVDWLLCDANLAPTVALRYLAFWSKQLRPKLRGIVFTLKLNDEKMVQSLAKLLTRAGELGFGPARSVQLPSNRREIAVLCTREYPDLTRCE